MRRAVVLRTAVTGAALMSMTFVGGCSSGDATGQVPRSSSGSSSPSGSTSSASASASAAASPTSASPTNSGVVPPSDASKAPGSGGGDDVAGAPGVPEPARHHTKDGAIAFAKHYVDLVNETGIHPKTGVLEPLALDTCKSCNNFEETVKTLVSRNLHFDVEEAHVIDAKAVEDPVGYAVTVTAVSPEVRVLDANGQTTSTLPKDPQFDSVYMTAWTNHGWRLAAIKTTL